MWRDVTGGGSRRVSLPGGDRPRKLDSRVRRESGGRALGHWHTGCLHRRRYMWGTRPCFANTTPMETLDGPSDNNPNGRHPSQFTARVKYDAGEYLVYLERSFTRWIMRDSQIHQRTIRTRVIQAFNPTLRGLDISPFTFNNSTQKAELLFSFSTKCQNRVGWMEGTWVSISVWSRWHLSSGRGAEIGRNWSISSGGSLGGDGAATGDTWEPG